MTSKPVRKRVVKAWAWVYTDPEMHTPIIAIDESKELVSGHKHKSFYGDPYSGKMPEAKEAYNKTMRVFYRKSKIVPCTISYTLPAKKNKK